MTLYTTLNRIRSQKPCKEGWEKLLKSLNKTSSDDESLDYLRILQSNGLDDTLWCFRVEPQYSKHWRLIAVRFVRDIEHLLTDQRSRNALDVAEKHAHGLASDDELNWAASDASDASDATRAARAAVWVAVSDASDATRAAAREKQKQILIGYLNSVSEG